MAGMGKGRLSYDIVLPKSLIQLEIFGLLDYIAEVGSVTRYSFLLPIILNNFQTPSLEILSLPHSMLVSIPLLEFPVCG